MYQSYISRAHVGLFKGHLSFCIRKNLYSFKIKVDFFNSITKNRPITVDFLYIVHIWCSLKDSNLGPTGYEPVALTN